MEGEVQSEDSVGNLPYGKDDLYCEVPRQFKRWEPGVLAPALGKEIARGLQVVGMKGQRAHLPSHRQLNN